MVRTVRHLLYFPWITGRMEAAPPSNMPKLLEIIVVLIISTYTAVMGYSFGVVTETDASIATSFMRQIMHRPGDTSTYATRDWKTWNDGRFDNAGKTYSGFSVKYPRDFEAVHGEEANGNFVGRPSVKLSFPRDAYATPKTNFGEAYMTISVDDAKDAVRSCYNNPDAAAPEKTLQNVVTVAGIGFHRAEVRDAAAGNRYDSRVYRVLRGSRCYEAVLTVHTGAIGNYDPGTVAEFDKEKAFSLLQKMLTTFQFTDKAPTP